MALDSTISGASSNSYVSLVEANTHFTGRLYADNWNDALPATRERALITATNRIEQETFKGYTTTTTQALKWPRKLVYNENGIEYDDAVIPRSIKHAVFELALAMLESSVHVTATAPDEPTWRDMKREKLGDAEWEYREGPRRYELPASVGRLLAPFLVQQSAGIVRLVRT